MSMRDTDPGFKKLKARLAPLMKGGVAVGLFPDAGNEPGTDMTTAQIGAVHEFGGTIKHPGGTAYAIGSDGKAHFVKDTSDAVIVGKTQVHEIRIPQRSFLRATIDQNKGDIDRIKESMLDGVLANKMTADQAYTMLGMKVAAMCKARITEGISPANAASTIRRKKSSKPLVGKTSHMINSITFKLRRGAGSEKTGTVVA